MSRYSMIARRWTLAAGLAVGVVGAACKRHEADTSNPFATSLMFDDASPDAREALATTVNFRVTDENFARWELAQDNLDRLPRSAINSSAGSGGSAIDRAVMRLQSSQRARRAIESAGLTVRDFVLETIALAQATLAIQPGTSAGRSAIVAANSRFVSQYQARLLRSRAYARSQTPESFDVQPGMADDVQPEPGEVEQMRQSENEQELEAQRRVDSAQGSGGRRARTNADSARDSVADVRRDTVPGRNR